MYLSLPKIRTWQTGITYLFFFFLPLVQDINIKCKISIWECFLLGLSVYAQIWAIIEESSASRNKLDKEGSCRFLPMPSSCTCTVDTLNCFHNDPYNVFHNSEFWHSPMIILNIWNNIRNYLMSHLYLQSFKRIPLLLTEHTEMQNSPLRRVETKRSSNITHDIKCKLY